MSEPSAASDDAGGADRGDDGRLPFGDGPVNASEPASASASTTPRKRGRPKGSKNKPKATDPKDSAGDGGSGSGSEVDADSEKGAKKARKTSKAAGGGRGRKKAATADGGNGATLGFEDKLWEAADLLRGSMSASDYKHVVLGLIFLKYISDAFEEHQAKLVAEADATGADPEDPDEYRGEGIFWVPKEARWATLQAQARQPTIGVGINAAMEATERANPSLKGVLPDDFASEDLDQRRLGELIDLIANIRVGDEASRSRDVLGRVYEYFLGKFASKEGQRGGEFYTPRAIVRLLVEMIEPFKGRVYDPCCGSSGMFVQSEEFIREHGGRIGDVSIFGQELNATTWRLAKMNLAIRGIDGDIRRGDTFHEDRHPDLKADFILANPPFNISEWGGERLREDRRWNYGAPPVGNANFAWVQHMIHHLAPGGIAGFVLANGSMSSNQSGEGEIRQRIVEADLVDCMIALPSQLFYGTQIPACLWFLARDKRGGKAGSRTLRDRRGETLFIDARKVGFMADRTRRDFTDEDVARIADTYHAWRGEAGEKAYEDVPGFCKSATSEEITTHGFVLTPGRYVGAEEVEDDGEPFEQKMKRLVAELREQQAEGARLDGVIAASLRGLGYGE